MATNLLSILQGQEKPIHIVDRKSGSTFQEIVLSEDGMRVLYGSQAGIFMTSKVLTHRLWSKLYGAYNDSAASKHKIAEFAQTLHIDLEECEKDIAEYESFNDFFARKLKPGAREIDQSADSVVSPGDGRLFAFQSLNGETLSFVKWAPLRLLDLFGQNASLAERFSGGSAIVLRLCPADYHRFHFPVSGKVGMTRSIDGMLHSVNPYAMESGIPVYCLNKRSLCEVDSPEFGKVVCMEIGALFVGSIVQTYRAGMQAQRGDEKGYFKFGGSTVAVFFEKDRVTIDPDLIANTESGLETLVKMGEKIGSRLRNKHDLHH